MFQAITNQSKSPVSQIPIKRPISDNLPIESKKNKNRKCATVSVKVKFISFLIKTKPVSIKTIPTTIDTVVKWPKKNDLKRPENTMKN